MSKVRTYQAEGPEVTQLKQQDQALIPLFDTVGDLQVVGFDDPFQCLMFFILNQQISLKAAKTLYERLHAHDIDTPNRVKATPEDALKALGLSKAKRTTMRSVAHAAATTWYTRIDTLRREDLEKALLALPGIGPWTVAMFLMFYRFDEDVFTVGDLGLRHALATVLNSPNMSQKAMLLRSKQWAPYRSIVAHYLWAFREGPNSHL